MRIVTAEELKKKLDAKEDMVVVNALGKEQFEKKHIPGSINIPADEVSERAEKELPDKSKKITVYCANTECQASPTAAKKLEEMGYTNVADFEAGMQGWEEAGYPVEGAES